MICCCRAPINTDAVPSAFAGGVPSCVPSCSSGQVRLRIAASSSKQMVSVVEGEQKPVRKRMRMCEEDGETEDKIEPRMGKPAVNDKHLLKRDDGVIHGSLGAFQLSRRQRMCTRRDSNFNPKLLPRCQLRQKVDPCLAGDLAKLEVDTAMWIEHVRRARTSERTRLLKARGASAKMFFLPKGSNMDVNWELNDIDFCLSQFEGVQIQVIESLFVEAHEDLRVCELRILSFSEFTDLKHCIDNTQIQESTICFW